MKHLPILRALALLALAGSVHAATLTLAPTADAFIRTGQFVGTKNTTNVVMLVGATQTANDAMRGLLTFDLTDPVLSGAKINRVTLVLKIHAPDTGGENRDTAIDLHPVAASFTEGGVSWDHRSGSQYWSAKGGDYSSVIATSTANAGTVVTKHMVAFSDPRLTAKVGASLGGPVSFLLKLTDEESGRRDIFRFGTIQGAANLQPALLIDYTPAS
jgi:hypothetical protein